MKIVPFIRNSRNPYDTVRDDVERLLSTAFNRTPFAWDKDLSVPSMDMWDDKNTIFVETDIPGMEAKDINVSVKDDLLTVSAKREVSNEEKEERLLLQ